MGHFAIDLECLISHLAFSVTYVSVQVMCRHTMSYNMDACVVTQRLPQVLMLEFDMVIAEFGKLKQPYQDVIADITNRMGNGMADFAEKRDVDTKEDYYLYCDATLFD